jgi:urate oxidase
MIELGANAYGKSAIRLVKVVRGETPHRVRDLTIAIALEGDFAASYVEGDNAAVIATDTMKNTAYALAGEHLTGAIEDFALVLGRHFLASGREVARARVTIAEHAWRPIGDAPDAFTRDGSETRTAVVAVGRSGTEVRSGIDGLSVMKTTRSAFSGFPRDRFTTLKETDDRIMATKVTASWLYGTDPDDFDRSYGAVRETFLATMADHHSVSVQASIWIVGRAILERHPEVAEVSMSLPNLHHWTVDLAPFGIENDREVYVSTTEPHGLIEATVRRSASAAD